MKLSDEQKQIIKKRSIQALIGIVITFVLVMLVDKVIMPWYVRLGDEIEMPDVVEREIGEAERLLEKQHFKVHVIDSVYDERHPEGTVIEQMPLPYSTVKKGRNVYLKVSIGEKPIIMPNLFYISPRDAELTLRSYGLELVNTYYAYSDLTPEGVVVAQSYPQGQRIKKGTEISITVSLGPMPENKVIPELYGKSLDAVREQLKLLGVEIIDIRYEERDNILPETVLKQSLDPGTPIDENTRIALTVSTIPATEEEVEGEESER